MMQRNDLCERCRILERVIEEFEEPGPLADGHPNPVNQSYQEVIPRSSFDANCRLCIQLSSLLQACAGASETSDTDMEAHGLVLKCRYWWHPDLERQIAFHRISHNGKMSYVFLRLHGALPLSIVNTSQADYTRLRDWSRNCRVHHDRCTLHDRVSSENKVGLKAIDCKTRTIRAIPPHADYVCLSYVWGISKTTPPQTSASRIRPLFNLPKTIEDAIYVTLQLGITFLWVDRYCIDQQDPGEKHEMISNMDHIYQNATFTIIAAEGDSPHAGLPGVCGTPRRRQRVLRTRKLTLVGIESISRYVQDSKWNTRGWTYQEMLLSRRILLFTHTRMYFQCLSGFDMEGITTTMDVPGTKPVFPNLQGNLHKNTILDRLSEYFKRSLSFRADAIQAVLGIFNALSTTEAFSLNHFYGMPAVLHRGITKTVAEDFIERLTWVAGTNRPTHIPGQRLGDEYGTERSSIMPGAEFDRRTDLFPSWSWAAFKASCPETEQANGLRLVFPSSHKQVDSQRCFDATDTEIRIHHRTENRNGRMSNFVRFHHNFDNYEPWIDITAWTWNDLFSADMLDERLNANKIALHFDDLHSLPANRLTAIHTITYKTGGKHKEEQLRRRVSGHSRERCYHIRMLLVKRSGFQTYARVGVLTVDVMWRGDSAPGSVEEILKGLMTSIDDESRSCWTRKTLRLV